MSKSQFADRRFFAPVEEETVAPMTALAGKPGGAALLWRCGVVRMPDGRFFHDLTAGNDSIIDPAEEDSPRLRLARIGGH